MELLLDTDHEANVKFVCFLMWKPHFLLSAIWWTDVYSEAWGVWATFPGSRYQDAWEGEAWRQFQLVLRPVISPHHSGHQTKTDKQNAVLRLLPWDREWETFESNIWPSGGETSGSKSKWTLFHVQRGQFCARKCKCPRRSARGLKVPTEGSMLHWTSGEK